MKAYLIDFENVKSKGLTGIEQLSPDDKVIIFYSENSDTISFEMHRKVMTSTADIEYLKVRVGGKNALDFQLSTLLGYLLAKGLYTHIFVISGDKGFDKLHDFWNVSFADRNSVTVFRTQTLLAAVAFANASKGKTRVTVPEPAEEIVEETAEPAAEEASEPVSEPEAEAAAAVTEAEPAEEAASEPEAAPVAEPVVPEVTITKTPRKRGRKPQSAEELIHNALLGIVDITDKDAADILACASEAEDKEDFHNRLAKIFKAHATDLYKVLRPKYLRIKEALEETAEAAPAAPAAAPEIKEIKAETEAPRAKEEVRAEPAAPAKPAEQKQENKHRLNDSELFDAFLRECEEASKRSEAYEYAPQEQLTPDLLADQPEPVKEEAPEPEAVPEEEAAPAPKPKKRTTRKKQPAKAKKSRLTEELEKLLAGQCSPEEIAAVSRIFEETDTKQKLYLSIVKESRKDRGCEIYKLIRSDYNILASFKENAAQTV